MYKIDIGSIEKLYKDYINVSIGENIVHVAHLQGISVNQKVVGLGQENFEGDDPAMWASKITGIMQGFGVKKARTFCVIPSNIVTTKNIVDDKSALEPRCIYVFLIDMVY